MSRHQVPHAWRTWPESPNRTFKLVLGNGNPTFTTHSSATLWPSVACCRALHMKQGLWKSQAFPKNSHIEAFPENCDTPEGPGLSTSFLYISWLPGHRCSTCLVHWMSEAVAFHYVPKESPSANKCGCQEHKRLKFGKCEVVTNARHTNIFTTTGMTLRIMSQ